MTKRTVRETVAETLEIPPEVALNTIKIILLGRSELKAINHRGIVVYETERIVFRTESGQAEVKGKQLTLAEMNDEFLRIEGRIDGIRLAESGEVIPHDQ